MADRPSSGVRRCLDGVRRARDDGTLGQLLADLLAEDGMATGPRIAAEAAAFVAERRRQYGALRLDVDHAMRGAVNAVSLAAAVQRQSGADTSELVARQAARLERQLDGARGIATEPDDRPVRPRAFEPGDVGRVVRDAVAEWNADRCRRPAVASGAEAAMARFDAGRIREAVLAMLAQLDATDAVDLVDRSDASGETRPRRAPDRRLCVAIGPEPDGDAIAIVVALDDVGGPPAGGIAIDREPGADPLLAQTAAAHGGDLAVLPPDGADGAGGAGRRLRLRIRRAGG